MASEATEALRVPTTPVGVEVKRLRDTSGLKFLPVEVSKLVGKLNDMVLEGEDGEDGEV